MVLLGLCLCLVKERMPLGQFDAVLDAWHDWSFAMLAAAEI